MKIFAHKVITTIFISATLFVNLPASSENQVSASSEMNAKAIRIEIVDSGDLFLDLRIEMADYDHEKADVDGNTYDLIRVVGAANTSQPGAPQLPMKSVLIGIPPEGKVDFEVLSTSSQVLDGEFSIQPAPIPEEVSVDEKETAEWRLAIPEGQTSETVRIVDEAWVRSQRLIRLEYHPFEYDEFSGRVTWTKEIVVRLNFSGNTDFLKNAAENQLQPERSPFEASLESSVLNYDQALKWRTFPQNINTNDFPPDFGERFRIPISENGLYKLTYETLTSLNPALASINPQTLQMSSQGKTVDILVFGEQDASFDPGDYILFYGEKFSGHHLADKYESEDDHWGVYTRHEPDGSFSNWSPKFNATMLEKYTTENVYWLYIGTDSGSRMKTVNGDPAISSAPAQTVFRETIHAEKQLEWNTTHFTGEDTWFWHRFNQPSSNVFTTTLPSVDLSGSNATIRGEAVGLNYNKDNIDDPDHRTQVHLNSALLVDEYWFGKSRYRFEVEVSAGSLVNGVNELTFTNTGDGAVRYSKMMFDWFEIEYDRQMTAVNNQLVFQSAHTGEQKFTVNGFSSLNDIHVLDISNPYSPTRITNADTQISKVTFSDEPTELGKYLVVNGIIELESGDIRYYHSPDWAALNAGVEYVVITPAIFEAEAEILANYRADKGLTSAVITLEDLYNDFNYGIFHPIAIKNFVRYAFADWQTKPAYAVLVGDGHWNFLENNPQKYAISPQHMPPNLAFVDPWQGEIESTNLLGSVVGDDPLVDLHIGRIPVNTSAELSAYINKLKKYEAGASPELWAQNHLFIADNVDTDGSQAGNFKAFAENMVNKYIAPSPIADPIKIYQYDYGCLTGMNSSENCANVRSAITNTINITGALTVNYIGHASIQRWSQEDIFSVDEIPQLTNSDQLPVVLSMTCLDGYWSGPLYNSNQGVINPGLIEQLLRTENTGIIGAFSPTGLGVSTGHDIMHQGFYYALLEDGNWEIGGATYQGLLWLFSQGTNNDLLHTYTIFGDPALQLQNPFNFSVSPDSSVQSTDQPGTILEHVFVIKNTGTATDSYVLDVSGNNWPTTLPFSSTNEIQPGKTVKVKIEVATSDQYNEIDQAVLTVRSANNNLRHSDTILTTKIVLEIRKIFLPLLSK